MASCPCIRAVRITTPDLGWIKRKNLRLILAPIFRLSYGPACRVYKPTSGMTKIASESPATKTEEPCIDILFTGKACFAISGFVSTLFFTSSEFSHIFCTELVLK